MQHLKAYSLVGLLVALLSSGCGLMPNLPFQMPGSTPGATSTMFIPVEALPSPSATPTVFIPDSVTPIAPSPTVFVPIPMPATPSVFIPPLVPASPTLFIPPTVTATPTLYIPPTLLPSPTRFIPPTVAPVTPGVYVQSIRLDPPDGKQKQDITFYVRFLNTTGKEQEYRWFVFIYPEGKSAPLGQTSSDKAYKVPPGASELASFNTWKVGGGQPCMNFVAKVHWLGADGAKPAFSGVDGGEFALPLTVCP